MKIRFAVVMGAAWLAGCATGPQSETDPRALLEEACKPGRGILGVKGSVWLKAQSKEASGQFPAVVDARPDRLRLEAINLTGGTEAVISVENGKYHVDLSRRNARNIEGQGSWGGIPLRWATDLFLGRIPCPAEAERAKARYALNSDRDLVVETTGERFTYGLKSWAGGYLATSMRWERLKSSTAAVDFKFSDPEDGTSSPKKWEAKSALGEVKVRWTDREVAR